MNSGSKSFLNWFGYSRRERRSTFILLIILILIILLRYLLPQKDIRVENLSGLLSSADKSESSYSANISDSTLLFSFDPNTAPYDTLIKLGFSGKLARTIIKYRNSGGKFRKPSDVKKIYGMDEQTAERITPFIDIKTEPVKVIPDDAESYFDQKKVEKIDLNKADSAILESLPGLGPVLSSRIIKFRKLLGGFASAEQLREVFGLTEETYKFIESRVFADSSDVAKISVNGGEFNELTKHPYLENYDIRSILKYKELKGKVSDINELVENKILTAIKARKISPYLRF
jgi:competence protein ComEA